jgi:hypothetical protein
VSSNYETVLLFALPPVLLVIRPAGLFRRAGYDTDHA